MRNFSRYLLVGLLMMGMTVNTASAAHWLYDMGCSSSCQPPVIEICPPVERECCLPVECCHELATDVIESPAPGPAPSALPAEELLAPPTAVAPEPDAVQPESSIVNRPTFEADDTEIPTASETALEPEPDSLFDAPATPAPMPEESPLEDSSPADDLLDEPIATEDSPAEEGPLEELLPFSEEETEEETEMPLEPAPEDPAPEDADETEDPSFDDLFGQPVLRESGGLASHAVRWWTDDGARFRCEARLQQVTAKTVVLVKSNGKRIAVFFSRLSDDDLQFVRRQVVAQRELLAQQASAELLASLEIK